MEGGGLAVRKEMEKGEEYGCLLTEKELLVESFANKRRGPDKKKTLKIRAEGEREDAGCKVWVRS
jgi:hypothetical protein